MMRRTMLALLAAGAAGAIAGCGERPQVVSYKQGTYQGKPDAPSWAQAPWNGNRQDWENAIRTRNQAQNEYKRIGG